MKLWLRTLALSFMTSSASYASAQVVNVKNFSANTVAGRGLLAAATRTNDEESSSNININTHSNSNSRSLEDADTYFLGSYSIKFQDCHSVTQWNGDYDEGDESDSRVISRRLVRFRLCPTSSCANNKEGGCSSKFGDYIVDINTFLYYYLSAQKEFNGEIEEYCADMCAEEDGGDNCESNCFEEKGGFEYYDGYSAINPVDYAQCKQFKNYLYLGPYCSEDGASIHMGIFSEETCSTFASCGSDCFYSTYGFELPYTSDSLVSQSCMNCAYNSFYQGNYNKEPRDECGLVYTDSGKCETKMYIDYPNESACTYIEGIKYLGADGVISGGVKRNKVAGMAIGLLSFSVVLFGIYVHYLMTKLERAKFHLDGTSEKPRSSSRRRRR